MRIFLIALMALVFAACTSNNDAYRIEGKSQVWEVQTLSFKGPEIRESREAFTDYVLIVHFSHYSEGAEPIERNAIGYYAADGNAAETGTSSGNIWQAKFVPERPGNWMYEARLIAAPNFVINEHHVEDSEITFQQNWAGEFEVAPADLDPTTSNFARRGMLQDVKGRYLRYGGETGNGTDELFIKTGAGSPENLLAYSGFDGTYDVGGSNFSALGDNQLHEFEPHLKDAKASDPTWQDGKGAAILGIANYYEDVGVNAQYIVSMNVEGDGQDVFPWASHDDPYVFDVSKLEQWQRVLEHFNSRGVLIDMLLTETENESWFEAFDGVEVGEGFAPSRKHYYREMVARFGHLNGLVWNLGEENGIDGNSGNEVYRKATSAKQRLAFGQFIAGHDPYNHAIVSHNWPDIEDKTYGPKLGVEYWSGISSQAHYDYAKRIIEWAAKSKAAGRPWMVTVDEPLGWEYGAHPDADVSDHRREIEGVLWPALLAGGAGVDWYFGWQNNALTSDLSNEDQRSRDGLWRKSAQVRKFLSQNFDMNTLEAQLNSETGTLITQLKDKDGHSVMLTLMREKPELPEGEGHSPWEYIAAGLTLDHSGASHAIDLMNPVFPDVH